MKGLEQLINDLARVTCPSEHELYQATVPCEIFHQCSTMHDGCVKCWKTALESEVPVK
jgi:hypothetical protein